MSFQARLVLGNNEYNVLDCEFELTQPVGRHNLPNHGTEVGLINIVVESGSTNELLDWGMSTMTKTGSIVFYRRDAVAPMKTLEFEQAFCIKYKEMFNHEGNIPMRTKMTISPFMVRMQGIGLAQPWAGFRASNNSSNEQTTTSPQNSDSHESESSSSSSSGTSSSSQSGSAGESQESGSEESISSFRP